MFEYRVNDDEETERQMFPRTLRFLGWRDWILIGLNVVILYKILCVVADCFMLYVLWDEDGSQLLSAENLVYTTIISDYIVELILLWNLKRILFRIVRSTKKETIDLKINLDFISINGISYAMDDVMEAEAYSNPDEVDLYLKFRSVRRKRKSYDVWLRLTPENLIHGNHQDLIFFLKERLRDRIRVFVTASERKTDPNP